MHDIIYREHKLECSPKSLYVVVYVLLLLFGLKWKWFDRWHLKTVLYQTIYVWLLCRLWRRSLLIKLFSFDSIGEKNLRLETICARLYAALAYQDQEKSIGFLECFFDSSLGWKDKKWYVVRSLALEIVWIYAFILTLVCCLEMRVLLAFKPVPVKSQCCLRTVTVVFNSICKILIVSEYTLSIL